MTTPTLRLKKNEERRLRAGHLWVYSNEIDTRATPLKHFAPGDEVIIQTADQTPLARGYINPHSLITARILSFNHQIPLDGSFFATRIKAALALREQLFPKPFYRLIYGDSDGLPGLVVDRFGDHLVAQINTAGMEVKTALIIEALTTVLPTTQSILLRNDSSARITEGLEKTVKAGFNTPPETILIEENDCQFRIPLWSGQKTGWFYDHRANRQRLSAYVPDKRVLDVFSYLGAWGIQAAHFGARDVTFIDSSALALSAITENMQLNNLKQTPNIIIDDAFQALKKLHQAQTQFEVVIVDPPAFVKKQKDKKEGLIAYQRLNEAALKILRPGGILVSCSCSMHISYDELVQAVRRAGIHTKTSLQLLERGFQAPDHPVHLAIPETDYLKMLIVRVG